MTHDHIRPCPFMSMYACEAPSRTEYVTRPWPWENVTWFRDPYGRLVTVLDSVVEYNGERRGIFMQALDDGQSLVLFRDTKKIEATPTKNLCKGS